MLLGALVPATTSAQMEEGSRAWADSLYQGFQNITFQDKAAVLEDLRRMEVVYSSAGDSCAWARVASWKSNCLDGLGQLDSAMHEAQRSLALFRPSCDSLILMSIQANLSGLYLSLNEFDKVLATCDRALKVWNPGWAFSQSRNGLYTNKAIALAYKGDLEAALVAFRDVLRNARQEKRDQAEADALNNISVMFGMMAKKNKALLDSVEHYNDLSLAVSKRLGDENGIMILYSNLASLASDRKRHARALAYLDSAQTLAERKKDLGMQVVVARARHKTYREMGMLDSAYTHFARYEVLKDSLLDTEKVRAIADVQEKYESEKKARTIKELEVEKLDALLRQTRLKRTRNIYMFTGIGILLFAGGLWSRLRFVARSRAAIAREKEISEGLLLNILPEEVAQELKEKGEAEAQLIDQVTVLFTDFKGFTAIAEKLGPKELVRDIHECFSAFDRIMEEHGIEKIKTIGDAYMAAGGLPTPNATHAYDVIQAAFKIKAFIEDGKARKIAAGLPYFEIRIGIHTGPVVAGIVGVKKFAYDIWGDTVNTASRMESSGAAGEVNISGSTYALVKGLPGLTFVPRGKVQAKGKGELEMYFVRPAEG